MKEICLLAAIIASLVGFLSSQDIKSAILYIILLFCSVAAGMKEFEDDE